MYLKQTAVPAAYRGGVSESVQLASAQRAVRRMFSANETERDGPGDKVLALFEKRLSEIEVRLRSNLCEQRTAKMIVTASSASRSD